ncbi:hypothetical protein DL93DRAFT_228173 [Clavulina sp. PMI_390]|nr:hypothetical protein DL93DRAFT_228173 [Clavulina sp. PMI_390]
MDDIPLVTQPVDPVQQAYVEVVSGKRNRAGSASSLSSIDAEHQSKKMRVVVSEEPETEMEVVMETDPEMEKEVGEKIDVDVQVQAEVEVVAVAGTEAEAEAEAQVVAVAVTEAVVVADVEMAPEASEATIQAQT